MTEKTLVQSGGIDRLEEKWANCVFQVSPASLQFHFDAGLRRLSAKRKSKTYLISRRCNLYGRVRSSIPASFCDHNSLKFNI